MKEIIIATRNKGKIKEFSDFFEAYEINVKSLLDFEDVPEVEENGKSFEENAALKAEQIAHFLQHPVLADDSGLVVDYLDGEPGIYSARYAGVGSTDEENNQKLLKKLQNIPESKRSARFVCVLAISIPGENTVFFKGFCEGKIAFEPLGKNGFGYDPLFIPEGYEKTMAQLSPEEKNKISHRKNAFDRLRKTIGHIEKLL